MMRDLILKNRSYRRFIGDFVVKKETLENLIDLARLSPSTANLQPLKYILSCDKQKNSKVFSRLHWAGYLKDWSGPEENERPSAYIVILGDTKISKNFGCDYGITAQSILLGAAELGLGGCMVGSIDRENLRKDLNIPTHYETLLVLALGKPKEKVVIESVSENQDIKYWRDKDKTHHVPKRRLKDIIIN